MNAEILASAGLVSHVDRPVKVLGSGDLDVKVFVAADAFTKSARSKIEDAGGYVQVLAPEPPAEPEATAEETPEAEPGEAVKAAVAVAEASTDEAPQADVAAASEAEAETPDDNKATE